MSASAPLTLHHPQKTPASPRARVKAMLSSDVTVRRITVESGVKSADIKAWVEGRPVADEVETRIAAWLEELDEAAAQQLELPWVETPMHRSIQAAFEQARITPTIGVVIGPAGVGKTTSVPPYVEDDFSRDRRTYYFAATRFTTSPSAVLFKLAEVVDRVQHISVTAGAYRGYALYQAIERVLRPGDLIVVDEAQHIEAAALDAIRAFHDDTRCGIVYMGNAEVFARILGKGRRAEFAQLASRCGVRLELTTPDENTIDTILGAWGVKGSMERQFLHQIGSGPGGIRQMRHVVRQATIAAQEMKRPLDAQILRAAASLLGLDQ